MSAVDFHVSVSGQDPHPLFVQEPNAATVSEEIDAVAGLTLCSCRPFKCSAMLLEGTSKESEVATIGSAIKKAYLKANAHLMKDAIGVKNIKINNRYKSGMLKNLPRRI